MQPRSSRKAPSPKSQHTLQEVRVPSKKRDASAAGTSPGKEASPRKKRRSPKIVHFENKEYSAEDETLQSEDSLHDEQLPQKRVHDLEEVSEGLSNDNEEQEEEEEEEQVEGEEEKEEKEEGEKEKEEESLENKSNKENEDPYHEIDDNAANIQYLALKVDALEWANSYFPAVASDAENPLNFVDLCKNSPQLMEYTNYISACGKDPWERIFHEQRNFLVHGILGKMLEVHVFGPELFGANKKQLKKLREADIQRIMDDGMFFIMPSLANKAHPSFPPFEKDTESQNPLLQVSSARKNVPR